MRYVFIIFSLLFTYSVKADEIALTFDDLPISQTTGNKTLSSLNNDILSVLKKYDIQTTAFVNEGKLQYIWNGIRLLRSWVSEGHALANHTFSHLKFSAVTLDAFIADTLKNTLISKTLMRNSRLKYTYFRYPYLDVGATPEINAQFETLMKGQGYKFAPVTMDSEDWAFNGALFANSQNKKTIINDYVKFTNEMFSFGENLSQKLFGRNIRHIWLMHSNLLNAEALERVIQVALERGYTFVTLDRALKDEAYAVREQHKKNSDHFLISYGTHKNAIDWSTYPYNPYR